MQAKGQATNRESSLCEDKQASEKNSTLPTSRPTCPPSFSFQQRPFRKETSIQCVVNEGLVVGGIVEKNTQHDVEQSYQEGAYPDDDAHQSQRGAITARVLANLGLSEETEKAENKGELKSIQKLIEALQCSDISTRIAAIHTLMEHQAQISENVHLYLQIEFVKLALLECNWQQRIVAIRAIGAWGGGRFVSALKICLQHPYEYVRAAAAQAIADIGTRSDVGERLSDVIFSLLVASSDRHWVVRTAVIQAMRTLGQQNIGRQEFINAIILALDDEECMVRIAAVRALYELKGKHALPRLALIAERDFEYLVRDAAQDIVQGFSLH